MTPPPQHEGYEPSNAELMRIAMSIASDLKEVRSKQTAMALSLNTVTLKHGARLDTLERAHKATAWLAKSAAGAVIVAGIGWGWSKLTGTPPGGTP